MTHQPTTFDTWTQLEYKPGWLQGGNRPYTAPTWVGDHARRLEAYKLLVSYLENAARLYLMVDEDRRADRREYGDPRTIVETIVDAVLGEDVTIAVEGAGEVTEGEDPAPVDAVADAWQEWFDGWDRDERPLLSIVEAEEDAVGIGDGVYLVAWDAAKQRPTLTAYDPGFYFPVRSADDDGRDFPPRVHLAWEFDVEDPGTGKVSTFIRRITYELVLVPGLARKLPWNAEPTDFVCLKTDATWPLEALGPRKVDDLELARATFAVNADGVEVNRLDLGVDFIPLVHLPNTIARKEHYGRSSLALVLQLLDELQAADTDLANTARTTGFPPLGVEGTLQVGEDGRTIVTYGPGTVFSGKVSVVDTSTALDALLKYIKHLLKRLAVNVRLPEATLGLSEASEFKSGYHLELTFGPMKSMVRKMRLVRAEKYPLVLKFVARFAMLAGPENGGLAGTDDPPFVELQFGSFLPSDLTAEVQRVRDLFKERLISRLTAVKMLMELGLPIEDAEAEVTAIEHEDFEGAAALADALGSEAPAAEYLDRKLPEPAPAPAPPPPAPGAPGAPPPPVPTLPPP